MDSLELINKKALYMVLKCEALKRGKRSLMHHCSDFDTFEKNIEQIDDDIQTVYAAPVLFTLKHAKWIKPFGMMPPEPQRYYECSNCHNWVLRDQSHKLTKQCPYCEAFMENGEDYE